MMSEDLWLTFFPLEHSSEQTFAKNRENILDYIDTEGRKESQGILSLLFTMAIVTSISLSSGLLLLNLSKLSYQYEWPSEVKSKNNLLYSGQDFSSFRKKTGFTRERKRWLNGSQQVERSLPTTNKQIKTAAMQRIPARAVYFWDIQVSTATAHTWNSSDNNESIPVQCNRGNPG